MKKEEKESWWIGRWKAGPQSEEGRAAGETRGKWKEEKTFVRKRTRN